MGADCKSVANAYTGSNPVPATQLSPPLSRGAELFEGRRIVTDCHKSGVTLRVRLLLGAQVGSVCGRAGGSGGALKMMLASFDFADAVVDDGDNQT